MNKISLGGPRVRCKTSSLDGLIGCEVHHCENRYGENETRRDSVLLGSTSGLTRSSEDLQDSGRIESSRYPHEAQIEERNDPIAAHRERGAEDSMGGESLLCAQFEEECWRMESLHAMIRHMFQSPP